MYIEFPKLNTCMTTMYTDDTSILNVETNLDELERAMTVNTGKICCYFKEEAICTLLTCLNKGFYCFKWSKTQLYPT
jgi:hypothetical protein